MHTHANRELILASSSPIRAQILRDLGFTFTVLRPEIDEDAIAIDDVHSLVRRLAELKAEKVFATSAAAVILAADTLVEAPDGRILSKPRDEAETRANMRARSGSSERVITGICVLSDEGKSVMHQSSTIHYKVFSSQLQEEVIASGEWRGVCGGLRIEGLVGASISSIDGSYSNIQGLPAETVAPLLAAYGLQLETERAD